MSGSKASTYCSTNSIMGEVLEEQIRSFVSLKTWAHLVKPGNHGYSRKSRTIKNDDESFVEPNRLACQEIYNKPSPVVLGSGDQKVVEYDVLVYGVEPSSAAMKKLAMDLDPDAKIGDEISPGVDESKVISETAPTHDDISPGEDESKAISETAPTRDDVGVSFSHYICIECFRGNTDHTEEKLTQLEKQLRILVYRKMDDSTRNDDELRKAQRIPMAKNLIAFCGLGIDSHHRGKTQEKIAEIMESKEADEKLAVVKAFLGCDRFLLVSQYVDNTKVLCQQMDEHKKHVHNLELRLARQEAERKKYEEREKAERKKYEEREKAERKKIEDQLSRIMKLLTKDASGARGGARGGAGEGSTRGSARRSSIRGGGSTREGSTRRGSTGQGSTREGSMRGGRRPVHKRERGESDGEGSRKRERKGE